MPVRSLGFAFSAAFTTDDIDTWRSLLDSDGERVIVATGATFRGLDQMAQAGSAIRGERQECSRGREGLPSISPVSRDQASRPEGGPNRDSRPAATQWNGLRALLRRAHEGRLRR